MLVGKDLSYSRGVLPLFSGVSFTLQRGETLAVKGANGSGKSTFLRHISGLICPAPNTLFWEGIPLKRKNLSTYQQNLLYVGHKLCLHTEAFVKDQICFWTHLYGISEEVIKKALEIWDIEEIHNKRVSHLSEGQQKRLSLSRCSWLRRSLWILDEPQGGLDQAGKTILSHVLSLHLERKGSVVVATHEPISATQEIFL